MSLHEHRLPVVLTLLLHSLYVVVYMSYRLKCQFDFVFYKRQETLYVYLEMEELSLDQDCRCYVTAIQFLCLWCMWITCLFGSVSRDFCMSERKLRHSGDFVISGIEGCFFFQIIERFILRCRSVSVIRLARLLFWLIPYIYTGEQSFRCVSLWPYIAGIFEKFRGQQRM